MREFFKKIIITIITWQAKLVLIRYKPKIIAVTGSVGKTTTKDAIYAALSGLIHVRKSEKSFNSELGVPLSILGLPNGWNNPLRWLENIVLGFWILLFPHTYPEVLVLEVGTDRPGDIASVTKWLKPDIAVLTRLPIIPVHVEFFESVEHVIQEKLNLVRALKQNGVLVGNRDDERVSLTLKEYNGVSFGYGFNEEADVRVVSMVYGTDGATGTISIDGEVKKVSFPNIISDSQLTAAVAALAVSKNFEVSIDSVLENLKNFRTPPGRLSLIEGKHGVVIIDDTYNASPEAADSALTLLKNFKMKGRRVAILGDMLELGKFTEEAHTTVGEHAARVADVIVTVGIRAKLIAESAYMHGVNPKNVFEFTDSKACVKEITSIVEEGDLILIKGSQGVRLERVVLALMAHPEDRKKLLVRQEEEWEHR